MKHSLVCLFALFSLTAYAQYPVSPNKLDENGKRTGHWTILLDSTFEKEVRTFDSARFYRLVRFEAGKPVGKVRDFYRTGQKQWEGTMISLTPPVFEGDAINYHENGKEKYRATYVNGKMNGLFQENSINGKLLSQGMMKQDTAFGKWDYFNGEGFRWLEMERDGKGNDRFTEFHQSNSKIKRTGLNVNDIAQGQWITYYENGNLLTKCDYKNGLKDGKWEWYNSQGVLEESGFYKNDKKIGDWMVLYDGAKSLMEKGSYDSSGKKTGYWEFYYENGNKKSEGEFKNGSNHGNWKFYHDNGVVKTEGPCLAGMYEGEIKKYYPSGKAESVAMYVQDSIHGSFVAYYENGNVQTKGEKVHDKKDKLWSYYFEDGSLDGTEELIVGVLNGKTVNYYPNGKIKDAAKFINGNRTGLFTSYFANGQIEAKGFYENGKRIGEWNWYYENGQLDSKYVYKNGAYEGPFFSFYPDGKKQVDGNGLHGKLHGFTKRYFRNGALREEGNYIDGKIEGTWIYYDSLTGRKTSMGSFVHNKSNGKWLRWDENGKSKNPDYYFNGWQENAYGIRDSIYTLVKNKKYDQAWEAVSWAKKVISRDSPQPGKVTSLPAYLYGYILQYGKADYAAALPFAEEHLRAVIKYEGKESENFYATVNDIANIYSRLNRTQEALAMHDSLLSITHRIKKFELFNTYLYNKASTIYELGEKAKAENLFDDEINFQLQGGKDNEEVFSIREKKAEFIYTWESDMARAEVLYRDLYKDVFAKDPNHKRLLNLAQRVAYANNSLSRRPHTIHWLKAAVVRAEDLKTPSFDEYFDDLVLLANNYINMDYLDSANMTYSKMNQLLIDKNLLNTVAHAKLLDGQGEVYFNNNQNEQALTLWTQGKEILEKNKETKTKFYADVLRALGLAYNEASRYEEAERFYLQGLAIDKELNGETNRSYVASQIVMAGIYEEMSVYDKGEALLNKVIQTIGEKHPDYMRANYSDAMNHLADIKRDLGEYKEAIRCNEIAMVYLEENKANDPTDYADVLRDMALDYRRLDDFTNSEKYLMKAITIVEEAFGKHNSTYYNYLSSEANYYNYRGLYSDAVKLYMQIINGFEKLSGKGSVNYSHAIRNITNSYIDQGEYVLAETWCKQYYDLSLSIAGAGSYDYLDASYKLAKIKHNLSKTIEAEKLHRQCESVSLKLYGPHHPEYAYYLKERSSFCLIEGQLAEAEILINKATKIIGESAYGKNGKVYANYLIQQAKVLSARDKNKEAEQLLVEALKITGSNKIDYHYNHLDALEALADFYEKLGQYNAAEKLRMEVIAMVEGREGKSYNYALKTERLLSLLYGAQKYELAATTGKQLLTFFEGELAQNNHKILDLRNQLGLIELERKHFDSAAIHFKHCIEMSELNKTTESYLHSIYLNNLSVSTLAAGDLKQTERLLERSLQLRTRLGIKLTPPQYAVVTDNFASLYQTMGKLEKAEKYWLDVTKNLLNYTRENFYFMSDEEKSQFWKDIKDDFEYFNTFAVLRAKKNPAILGEMYNNQLATKAILLSASNKIKKRVLTSGDTAMVNHYYNWVEIRERLAQLYTSSDSELKNKKTLIDSLEVKGKNVEKELNISSEDLAQDKGAQSKSTTWKDVQRALSPMEAAVEIIRFRYFDRYLRDSVIYAALILTTETKQNPKLVLLPNGKWLEGRALRYYKNAIIAKLDDKLSYTNFWGPIDPVLKNKSRVFLSLDGVYNQINLNTLADADGKFLVESKNLTILSNTKDLLLLKTNRSKRTGTTTASLFGYPKYFIGKERAKEKILKQKRDFDFASIDETDATGINELPGTRTEITQVKNILDANHWKTIDYTDEMATEKAMKAIDYPSVLHIATHGFFVDDQETSATFKVGAATEYARQNPLLRSGLLLSGASNYIQNNLRFDDENGILTAYEAANLNLDNTDLVILSACETGKGEIQNGEGVYGLQRAFQTAGAQAIIMSLWKVDDEATQELMTSFYQNWMKGTEKAEAFRQAQLQLKNKYANPYYWGAFVMMGN
jgi:antitoxin component YwqK of YwqJK toxin-antitoxin module/CHAT domain-containing protein